MLLLLVGDLLPILCQPAFALLTCLTIVVAPMRAWLLNTRLKRGRSGCGLILQAYEINNAVAHLVQNTGQQSRIHMIIDAAEHVKPERTRLRPGQRCVYKGKSIHC